MNQSICKGRALNRMRVWAGLALGAFIVSLIGACGGGGSGVGVGGTGSFAVGPISGLASVIVNGIEFDDSAAHVEDEDGNATSRTVLRLGMTAEVDSGPVGGTSAAPTSVASRIRYASVLAGPVANVDVARAVLVVFGQPVVTTPTTVFDDRFAAGLASVAVGSGVRVYGSFDVAANGFVATRIEPAPASLLAPVVRATVRNLDTTARTFSLGAVGFSYAGLRAGDVPAGLANDQFQRVRASAAPVAGRWVVLAFGAAEREVPDADSTRLRGSVTSVTSSALFSIDGRPVDASSATFPDGTAGLVLGARVEARGVSVAGVLRATQVKVDGKNGDSGEIRLQGTIESHAPAQQTFVLRGTTVFYGAAGVRFDKGTAADIATGVPAEVRGGLSADGTQVVAVRVRIGG